jgi:hypothetical protein
VRFLPYLLSHGTGNHNSALFVDAIMSLKPAAKRGRDSDDEMDVWCELYFKPEGVGNYVKCGRATKVRVAVDADIDNLTEAVENKFSKDLTHCSAARLNVYPPGTSIPIQDDTEACESYDNIPQTKTTHDRKPTPLIVVAPPKPASQEGESQ